MKYDINNIKKERGELNLFTTDIKNYEIEFKNLLLNKNDGLDNAIEDIDRIIDEINLFYVLGDEYIFVNFII